MLRILNLLLSLLFVECVFAQQIPKKEGCIKVEETIYDYQNSNGGLRKRISNKMKRTSVFLYLDSAGNLIEKLGFVRHSDNNRKRILSFTEQNKFDNNNIIEKDEFVFDYHKNITLKYKTNYTYNDKNKLIKEELIYHPNQCILEQYLYEYDSIGNKIKSTHNPSIYYQRIFDSASRILKLQQIYNGILRWEHNYTYTDSTSIEESSGIYNEIKSPNRKVIRTYQNGKLKEIEEIFGENSTKTIIHYNHLGLIERLDYFRAYSKSEFELNYYTKIKINSCIPLKKEVIKKMNDAIFFEIELYK